MASVIPQLEALEARFQWDRAQLWLQENWTISAYCSAVYVTLIFLGKRWMRDRPAYTLRRPLAMWNSGLAVFSIVGFLSLFPPLLRGLRERGFAHTTCHNDMYSTPHNALWGFLFVLSKVVEFGDTFFVVLRKTPLNFLHWYHHITVFSYCAYNVAQGDPTGAWFGAANLFVHSVMYSYYVMKAVGARIPRLVAQGITLLQLVQFALGLTVIGVAYLQKRSGVACITRYDAIYWGALMYASYMILFINFFYQRYIKSSKTQ